MAWVLLLLAGALEIVWALGLKYSQGFTRLWPSVITVVAIIASGICLALAAKRIPIGTAYAVWTGIGAVGTAIFGMILLDEPKAWTRLASLALIVAGIVGLKLSTPE